MKTMTTISFIMVYLCAMLAAQSARPRQAKQTALGQWDAPVNLCTYPCLVGANAALLNNGSVLFYFYPATGTNNSQALVLNPVTGAITNVNLTVPDDIFCSGVTILPNGQVLSTGGNVSGKSCPHTASGCGTKNALLFDPVASTWSVAANMNYARWYPSSIELTDGTLLEISGTNETGKSVQRTLESYSTISGLWTNLPTSANLPSYDSQLYPRLSLMPNGKVFLSSPASASYQFNPATNTWAFVANVLFGYRYYGASVLLPGQEKVLVAGGSATLQNGAGTATNTAEVIDLSAARPAWSYTGAMTYARFNENLVLLADGTVLAVGGGGGGRYANPVLTAELYDPASAQWSVMAAQQVQRTYHSTAVLLPDGRVISAGSDNGAATQVTYEIFSPPYLFNGTRPTIQSAPTSLNYNTKFTITTADASTITRVALVRPGATTHGDNFDQRYVDLSFSLGTGTVTATSPVNGSMAPPGYYMLVIVNSSGVPSVMPFVQLTSSSHVSGKPAEK